MGSYPFMTTLRILPVTTLALGCCFAQAPALDDIVNKHIAAVGGAEKIRSIKTSKTTGKMMLGGGQMEATMTVWSHRPGKQRAEISFQGQKIVRAFDGTTGWMINPMAGSMDPQRMPDDESKLAASNVDPDGSPLLDYKAKGNTVVLAGREDVE